MSIKVVALVVITVGGVGAVLVLNPVDAKHAAVHSTKPAQKSEATIRQQMPSQRRSHRQPESFEARTESRSPGHQAPPGQPVTVNHDLSQQWSDDNGWEGTWDDDVPRPPQHIRPSVQGQEGEDSRDYEHESSVNDDESSDDSGGDR